MATDKVINLNLKLKYVIFFAAIATGIAGAAIAIFAFKTFDFGSGQTLGIEVIADRNKLSPEEISALVAKVSEILVLPEEETPAVLTITDLTQLKANPFFANAKVRDKVLIYKKAGQIIIYDPGKHRIVNIGPYNAQAEKAPVPTLSIPGVGSPALSEVEGDSQGVRTPSPTSEFTPSAN